MARLVYCPNCRPASPFATFAMWQPFDGSSQVWWGRWWWWSAHRKATDESPLPTWLRLCLCIVVLPPFWLRYCRCLVFRLPFILFPVVDAAGI